MRSDSILDIFQRYNLIGSHDRLTFGMSNDGRGRDKEFGFGQV